MKTRKAWMQDRDLDRLLGVRERVDSIRGGARVTCPLDEEWDLVVTLRPENGSPSISRLVVAPYGKSGREGGLTSRTLRSLKLGRVFDLFRQEAVGAWDDPLGPDGRLSRSGFTRVKPQSGRPGRRGHSDLFYASIAARYVAAVRSGSRAPVEKVAADLKLTADHVRDLLGVARKRGLLTRAPKGKAGGELTDLAKELLSESRPKGPDVNSVKSPAVGADFA